MVELAYHKNIYKKNQEETK
jgi:hypothetical protein